MRPFPEKTFPAMPSRRLLLLPLPLLLIVRLTLLGAPAARAAEAVLYFQTPDSKQLQTVTMTLFSADAPVTVANFERLARKGFYKNTVIHRAVPETLVGLGDPLSRRKDRANVGTGGPGYTLPAEIRRKHVRGAVAMSGLPGAINPARESNGSQFYVCLRALPALDKDFTVFGEVTAGLDFLDSLSRRGRDTNDFPLERILLRRVEIRP